MSEAVPIRIPEAIRRRFELERELGRGAFGAVFLAKDRELGRRVAVKLLLDPGNEEVRRRFLREAEALGRIRHPNVVEVFDSGGDGESLWLVLEYLEGSSLSNGPAGVDPLELMLQVADGLQAVHDADLLHRDLKPDNVLVTRSGRAVLVDFGLVQDPTRTAITREDHRVGTPLMMAPEILARGYASRASDWYAWGLTLYMLVEERLPWTIQDVMAVAGGKGTLPPLPIARLEPGSPAWRVVTACMARDPAERPKDAAALRSLAREGAVPSATAPGRDGPDPEATEARTLASSGPAPGGPAAGSMGPGPAGSPAAGASRNGGRAGTSSASVGLRSGTAPRVVSTEVQAPAATDRRGAAIGMLLVTAIAGAWFVGRPANSSVEPVPPVGEAPSPGPPTTPEATPTGRPRVEPTGPWADLGNRLQGDVERLSTVGLEGLGERLPAGLPADAGLGETDPGLWGAQVSRLPALAGFLDWIATGGKPEELPSATAARLVEVDEWMRRQGFPRPFHPFLYLRPRMANQGPDPPLPKVARFLALPPQLTGWLATQLSEAHEAGLARERAQRLVKATPMGPAGLVPFSGLGAAVQNLLPSAEGRSWLARVVGPGAEHLHATVYAAARAIRDEPEHREAAAVLCVLQMREFEELFASHLVGLEPDRLMAGPPGSPAAWLLRGTLIAWMDETRRRAGLAPQGRAEETMACYRAALPEDGPPGEGASMRILLALDELGKLHLDRGEAKTALELIAAREATVAGAPWAGGAVRVFRTAAKAWAALSPRERDQGIRERILKWTEALPPEARDTGAARQIGKSLTVDRDE